MNGLLLGQLLELFRLVRCLLYRLRRFWRSLYYAVTNALIILCCSVVLAFVWYICFL